MAPKLQKYVEAEYKVSDRFYNNIHKISLKYDRYGDRSYTVSAFT